MMIMRTSVAQNIQLRLAEDGYLSYNGGGEKIWPFLFKSERERVLISVLSEAGLLK
jgi:hypothetical protein